MENLITKIENEGQYIAICEKRKELLERASKASGRKAEVLIFRIQNLNSLIDDYELKLKPKKNKR